jgi:hypothetical protein
MKSKPGTRKRHESNVTHKTVVVATENSTNKANVKNDRTKNSITQTTYMKNNYFTRHWNILKNSFKLDSTTLKLILIDFGFILTLIFSYFLLYALWLRNLLTVSGLLNVVYSGQLSAALPGENALKIWNTFVFNVILLFILILLLYVIILSVYSAVSHNAITKNRLTLRLILNFLAVYSILTIIYLLFTISVFYLSKNIMMITWSVIIFTLIYLYFLLIFYLVTKEGKLSQIFNHGLRSSIKLHNTLLPILLAIILFGILTLLIQLVFGKILLILTLLVIISLLYTSTWIKRYLHHVIHS